jgi:hypothetical protein
MTEKVTRKKKYYLGVTHIVMPLILDDSGAVEESSFPTLTLIYAGCLGTSKIIVSLLSIETTSPMVGRSTAFSCTHNNAMLMHLLIFAE